MKKHLLFLFVFGIIFYANAQIYNADTLSRFKKEGKLNGQERFYNPNGGTINFKTSNPKNKVTSSSTICNCRITCDTTFHAVPFDGSGGSGGPGLPPDYANDDWSTNLITLPFNFCLYGTTYNSLYINNNGNVSFGAAYSTFTANSFPTPTYTMIAPFWSDCDSRGPNSKYVHYKLTSTALIVQWDSIGYYAQHDDKRNTYQLIITNGADSIIPSGNNVSFCYGDMQWTTGDASGGLNGFGGTPATVGVNKGDGVNYFQVGLFDRDSATYDGSYGNNDGVNWLDNRNIVANVCGSSNNVPPIAIDSVCDTVIVYLNQTINGSMRFLSPESGQITTATATGPSGFTIVNNQSANMANVQYQFTGSVSNIGYNTITFTAQDNGAGNLSTTVKKVIKVIGSTGIQNTANANVVEIFPNPASSKINIKINSDFKTKVYLKSILGEILLEQELYHGGNEINIENLKNGIYILEIRAENIILIKKILKAGE